MNSDGLVKNQFTLCFQEALSVGSNDAVFTQKDWYLTVDRSLPVLNVFSSDRQWCGWLLGYPFDMEKEIILKDEIVLPLTFQELEDAPRVEKTLYAFGGRYAAVLLTESYDRFYHDASSSLSAHYDLNRKRIGSMPERIGAIQDNTTAWAERWLEAKNSARSVYPGMLGLDLNYRLLPPNHYLDLQSWKVTRHWPDYDLTKKIRDSEVSDVVRFVADTVAKQIRILARYYPLDITCTGGQDSRSLIACSLPVKDRVRFVTYNNEDGTNTGVEVATSKTPFYDYFLPQQLAMIGKFNYVVNPESSKDRFLLMGYAGEIGRAFYYSSRNIKRPKSCHDLMDRMGILPQNDALDQSICKWFSDAPDLPLNDLLELAYIEYSLGNCKSPELYRFDNYHLGSFFPFGHRKIYEALISLPVKYKLKKCLGRDIVAAVAPELMAVPFNETHFVGMERYRRWMRLQNGAYDGYDAVVKEALRTMITENRPLSHHLTDDLKILVATGYDRTVARSIRVTKRALHHIHN